jgi:hypothetical protein
MLRRRIRGTNQRPIHDVLETGMMKLAIIREKDARAIYPSFFIMALKSLLWPLEIR